jgi:Peroxin-3
MWFLTGFTRTIVAVYSSALLALFLRVQLNILGGYMFRSTQSGYFGKVFNGIVMIFW